MANIHLLAIEKVKITFRFEFWLRFGFAVSKNNFQLVRIHRKLKSFPDITRISTCKLLYKLYKNIC